MNKYGRNNIFHNCFYMYPNACILIEHNTTKPKIIISVVIGRYKVQTSIGCVYKHQYLYLFMSTNSPQSTNYGFPTIFSQNRFEQTKKVIKL